MNRNHLLLLVIFCILLPTAGAAAVAQVSVSVSPDTIPSGGTGQILVTVTHERISYTSDTRDSLSTRPLPGATVTLSTPAAGITFSPSSGKTDSQGRFSSTLSASPFASGNLPVLAVAEIPGDYRGEGTGTVIILPVTTPITVPLQETNQPPVASLAVDTYAGTVPLTVFFDGRQSSDPDGAIRSYSWDFGDQTTGTGYVVYHTYEYSGSYPASLRVTDDQGRESDPVMLSIMVKENAVADLDSEKEIIPPLAKDRDKDGIADVIDNCPYLPNPDQKDGEMQYTKYYGQMVATPRPDGIGDACDNCPSGYNPGQDDSDKDGAGDGCDICPDYADKNDRDGDGIPDGCDNCPGVSSRNLQDKDKDGIGDVCDNCEHAPNPPSQKGGKQADADNDGMGDACDDCPGKDDHLDTDGDGIRDCQDNCPAFANKFQNDFNKDGVGDACDCADGIKSSNEDGFDCGGKACGNKPCTPKNLVKVTGRILFEDEKDNTMKGPDFEPIRYSSFSLIGCTDKNCAGKRGLADFSTDSKGNFSVVVPRSGLDSVYVYMGSPEHSYKINYATIVAHDYENCDEYVWWDGHPSRQTILPDRDVSMGDLKIGKNNDISFVGFWQEPTHHFLFFKTCGEPVQMMPGGSAYFNIADAILAARQYIEDRRSDNDAIDDVSVQFPTSDDVSKRNYWGELCIVPSDAFEEGRIIHEYGHHLEWTIGSGDSYGFLGLGNPSHTFCGDKGDSEFAWREGFPNYLGMIIPYTQKKRGIANLSHPFRSYKEIEKVGRMDADELDCRDTGNTRESTVTALLWDLADSPGVFPDSQPESFDNQEGREAEIIQIFDGPLDYWYDDAPDVCDFIKEMQSRTDKTLAPMKKQYNLEGC
jgi:PKD repeat protein